MIEKKSRSKAVCFTLLFQFIFKIEWIKPVTQFGRCKRIRPVNVKIEVPNLVQYCPTLAHYTFVLVHFDTVAIFRKRIGNQPS